ncbi:MAG: hypothetical protein ACRDK8_07955 [Solirubrobacteraceae bacterium]
MPPDQSLWISLEIDVETSPVSGRCCPEGHLPRPFTGWTELFAALDAAVSDARQGAADDPPAGGPPR